MYVCVYVEILCAVLSTNCASWLHCQVRSCKPGDAISIIETDCQVDFEAPKDYKEPQYTPAAASGPAAAAAAPTQPAASASGSSAAGAAAEEPEGPLFMPFVGSGRRLDGKASASSSGGGTPTSAAAAAAAARAAAGGGSAAASGAAVGGSKPGTFVSTGNRLADKLAMDKVRPVRLLLFSKIAPSKV